MDYVYGDDDYDDDCDADDVDDETWSLDCYRRWPMANDQWLMDDTVKMRVVELVILKLMA